MTTTVPERTHHDEVFDNLDSVCAVRGLDSLASRLFELRSWLAADLSEVEAALVDAGVGDNLAERTVRHLLDQGGKRLRPICVALAARTGSGFNPAARSYAVAVELVHNATLLHDDVVDVGDVRRGSPAAGSSTATRPRSSGATGSSSTPSVASRPRASPKYWGGCSRS